LSPSRVRIVCGFALAMWWPFAFSQTRLRHSLHFYLGQIRRPGLEGAAVPPGVPEAAAAAPQSAEAAAVPVVPADCPEASAFRADLPLCIRPDETFDNERPPRNTEHQPGLSGGGPYEASFALGIIYRAKSWTMRSVADAKWSATRNSSVASCYQPSSCLVDDDFHLGSVSSAVKCRGDPRLPIAVCGHAASGAERPPPVWASTQRLPAVCDQDRSALPASNAVPNRPAR
jgi:hypothetical protein